MNKFLGSKLKSTVAETDQQLTTGPNALRQWKRIFMNGSGRRRTKAKSTLHRGKYIVSNQIRNRCLSNTYVPDLYLFFFFYFFLFFVFFLFFFFTFGIHTATAMSQAKRVILFRLGNTIILEMLTVTNYESR